MDAEGRLKSADCRAPSLVSTGRPSAVTPHVKLERRISLFFALFFYGFIGLAGAIWLFSTGHRISDLFAMRAGVWEIALGLGTGILMAGAFGGFASAWKPARELEKEFGWI